jgi:polyphosphate glucokinase
LAIDIGGSGIKAAPVDLASGTLLAERYRLDTPSPATPAAISETVAQLVDHFHWQGAIGCGMPAVVCHGYVMIAANIAKTWIGQNARSLFENVTGCAVTVINDADAAGYAEMRFGAGRDVPGTVLLVTLGTGIGTALFINGCLLLNTELGHIEINGKEAEKWALTVRRPGGHQAPASGASQGQPRRERPGRRGAVTGRALAPPRRRGRPSLRTPRRSRPGVRSAGPS